MKRYCQVPNGIALRSVRPPVILLAVGQAVAGMAAVAVNVHLDIGDADRQHRVEVFDGPDGMTRSPDPAQAMKAGGTLRGIGGAVRLRAKGVGPDR